MPIIHQDLMRGFLLAAESCLSIDRCIGGHSITQDADRGPPGSENAKAGQAARNHANRSSKARSRSNCSKEKILAGR
jgi:hypothetical protein